MKSSDEVEKEEEANIYVMEKHEDDEANSPTLYFSYKKLFLHL